MNPVPVDSVANREYARALATIRGWRTFFVLFAVLGPLVHLLAWTAVRFGDVLREPSPPAAPATTTPPAGETNATNGVDEPVGAAQTPPVVPAEPVAATAPPSAAAGRTLP